MGKVQSSHPQLIHRCGQLCEILYWDPEVVLIEFEDGECVVALPNEVHQA